MPAMQTSSAELFQACATIFGPEIKISYDFLKYLQPVGIKTAYRKKAFDTHPDRAMVLGAFAEDLNAEFINVRQAYEKLLSFAEAKNIRQGSSASYNGFTPEQRSSCQNHRHYNNEQKHTRHNPKGKKQHYDHFYAGSFPKGNLMLGQFLYYSGLISWRTLIEAICWQRRQRPLIGQIAVSWRLIAYPDVLGILKVRKFDEKFGECALRIGYISYYELFALIGKQKKMQRPLGEFFIENGLLSNDDLLNIVRKQQRHNITG